MKEDRIRLKFEDELLASPISFSVSAVTQKLINKSISSNYKRQFKSTYVEFLSKKIILSDKIICAWCGGDNQTCFAEYAIDYSAMLVRIKSIKYKKTLSCCYLTKNDCHYKKLNPNSIEFVSKSRGISEREANEYILSRNKTPFYSKNHSSIDDYKKYQGSRCFTDDKIKNAEVIKKQNFSRSLDGFIQKYGKIDGEKRYKEYNRQKGITFQNLLRKYKNEEDALQKLNSWKISVGMTLENYIKKHGEEKGKEIYRQAVSNAGLYSKITFTPDGYSLRSNNERLFYESLIKNGVNTSDILIDQAYPNSSLRYDFFIKPLNMFIEIAGMNDKEYNEKMKFKEKQFGSLIVSPKEILPTVDKIVNFIKFKKENE